MDQQKFKCPDCSFQSLNLLDFSRHVKRHETNCGFTIDCPFCPRTYTRVRTWRRHLNAHKGSRRRGGAIDTLRSSPVASDSVAAGREMTPSADLCSTQESSLPGCSIRAKRQTSPEDKVAKFLAELESRGASSNLCTFVASKFSSFIQDVAEENIDILGDKALDMGPTAQAFKKLASTYQRV